MRVHVFCIICENSPGYTCAVETLFTSHSMHWFTCFVPDHRLLLCVFQYSSQCRYGCSVLHLSQAEGQLMFQEGRLICEGLTDPLYCISA